MPGAGFPAIRAELAWVRNPTALPPRLRGGRGCNRNGKLIGPERPNYTMAADTEKKPLDPGLACLVILLRIHGIAAEVEQKRRDLVKKNVS